MVFAKTRNSYASSVVKTSELTRSWLRSEHLPHSKMFTFLDNIVLCRRLAVWFSQRRLRGMGRIHYGFPILVQLRRRPHHHPILSDEIFFLGKWNYPFKIIICFNGIKTQRSQHTKKIDFRRKPHYFKQTQLCVAHTSLTMKLKINYP